MLKRFDSKSRLLLLFSSLCSLSFLALPIVRKLVDAKNAASGIVLWTDRAKFQQLPEIRCDVTTDTVSVFEGNNLTEWSFMTGGIKSKIDLSATLVSRTVPSTSRPPSWPQEYLATPDYSKIIGLSTIPYRRRPVSGQLVAVFQQLEIWSAANLKPLKAIPAFKIDNSLLSNVSGKVDIVTNTHVGVLENYSFAPSIFSPVRVPPSLQYGVYDIKTGNRLGWSTRRHFDYHSDYDMIKAVTPLGDILLGSFERNISNGKSLFCLQNVYGQSHFLSLSTPDQPKGLAQDWKALGLEFDKTQSRLWGATRNSKWQLPERTGTVICWDWKSGAPLWRRKEPATQPTTLALSANEKRLAVGSEVMTSRSNDVLVRLDILDAATGKVVETLRRERSDVGPWGQITNRFRKTTDSFTPKGNTSAVASLCWAPDGKSLIAAYGDGELIRWQTLK